MGVRTPLFLGAVILPAIAISMGSCAGQSDTENAPAASRAVEPHLSGFLEVEPGIELYYQRVGDGPQQVVIPAGMIMAEEFERLGAPERTLLFYDQRSRGKSTTITDEAKLGLEYELADLEALRQHFGFERVSLIGGSYLGGVVVRYALAHPDRVERIVQIGPISPRRVPHMDTYWATRSSRWSESDQAEMAVLREKMNRGEETEQDRRAYWRIFHKAMLYDPSLEIRVRGDYFTLQNELPRNSWDVQLPAVVGSFGDWDWRAELAEVSAPVLTIHGDHDALPLEGSREWVESLANARLLIVPKADHFPWIERPEIVFPAIDTFLTGE